MEKILIPESADRLPREYRGPVVISDIDKTYLATQIDSLRGLLRAAFETAERKQNVPGFSILLRALRRGAAPDPAKHPLFFVSASPPQLQGKLLAKMQMDGVEHEGIICKNQLAHVRKADFKKLSEQIGYKLQALMTLWSHLPVGARLYMFGDDSESDIMIYSLFSDIMAMRARGRVLYNLLQHVGVYREEALEVAWLARQLKEPAQPVQAVFINLETGTQPGYYTRFGSHVFPTENTLQAAFALFEMGMIREQAVRSVCRELIFDHDYRGRDLLKSLEAGARRGLYLPETLQRLCKLLHELDLLPEPTERALFEGQVTRLGTTRVLDIGKTATLDELKQRYLEYEKY